MVTADPVLKEAAGEEEKRLGYLISKAFQLAHGPDFRFFTATELCRLFEETGFSVKGCQIYTFPFDRRELEEIPMGPHWFQAYELLQYKGEKELIRRFEEEYFSFQKSKTRVIARGKMRWTIIKAVKD